PRRSPNGTERSISGAVLRLLGRDIGSAGAVLRRTARADVPLRRSAGRLRRSRRGQRFQSGPRRTPDRQGLGPVRRSVRRLLPRWPAAMTRPSLSPRAQQVLLMAYYAGVLIALVLMYGITPPPPPPFIYQGF